MQKTYALRSRFLNGGAPTHCQNPNCREPFVHSAWHGQDGKYYCNSACEDFAREGAPLIARTN